MSGAGLRTASSLAKGLQGSTTDARRKLREAHEGVGNGAKGFAVAGALDDVHTSWDTRLGQIAGDCDDLSGLFTTVAGLHHGNDGGVASSFDAPADPQP
ncbi:hypothetical protein ABZ832_12750 [Streptantibioticus parmotrematis]|uniref:hypothetical protein n=1 Tax=Streptantibioticus parmotrematis TaxID=2873249 RepID=UPI0033E6F175